MDSLVKNLETSLEAANLQDSYKCIILDVRSGTGIVPNPRGTIWSTMGRVVDSKMTIIFEEIIYLAEFLNYAILLEDRIILILELFSLFPEKSIAEYEIYKDLRRQGYILMAQDSPYYPLNKLFPDTRSEWSLFKPNSSFKKTDPTSYLGHLVGLKRSDYILDVVGLMSRSESESCKFMMCLPDGSSQFLYFDAELCQPLPDQSHSPRAKCKVNRK